MQGVVEVARAFGITSELQAFSSIALGTKEVSPLDLASAYGTFAADGIHIDPIFVTAIETHYGINLYQATPVVTQAVERSAAQTVTAALTEVVKRGTGQQARIGRPVAGKTGTSQDHRDAWFVGYTPELSAAVWVGFPEGQVTMEAPKTPFTITGGTWPAEIWSRFAAGALSATPYGSLPEADTSGMVTVEVDSSTDFLAGPYCPRESVQRCRPLSRWMASRRSPIRRDRHATSQAGHVMRCRRTAVDHSGFDGPISDYDPLREGP